MLNGTKLIPMHLAVMAFARDQLEAMTRRYARSLRPWHAIPRYSIFSGYGWVTNPDGSIARMLEPVDNALTNEGQTNMLNVYLKNTSPATSFNLGLLANNAGQGASAPAKTSTQSLMVLSGAANVSTNLYEENGGGYVRQAISNANWGTPTLNGGDEMSTAAQQTFGPASSAAWTGSTNVSSAAITYAFLNSGGTTSAGNTTGTLILYVALSASTIIAVGQSFNYTLNFKQT
jgi:hypothetical protein